MKKLATFLLATTILALFIIGCSKPNTPEQVQGLGKEEAAQIAAGAVRQYYHLTVDTADREITLEDPAKLIDAATGEPIYKGVPVHALLRGEPKSGDISGYHAIIEPKTKQLLSLSIDVIGKDGEKATKTIAEADLEKAAADFVRSQNLLATADFQLVRTSEATDNDLKRYFYYSDGHNAIAIGVDTALKQVVTFTYD
ncbi:MULTISPECIES: hypothetical protein [Brevibacillus]|jgi:hypothetical protein|uniref:Lipoprotein n=1 Tax=Brevibacillus parabrevis TaxID=54914 RepID=A0A4Y3PIY6_BREPA|nr:MULTISPECIES: hypothetical protein [Brevibacillus]MBU8715323.1 hypothetical protein [Brevibacillus parabrevis]MDH6352007.1 hypothetical protein [Brevibacillus sp. 1238]MDR4999742.1 hypothetical protein [Brevibacillus parabrevis]MED2257072.1 hypothetical protein [Brevibacillus parabrevis]NRQ56240.1 hypothetical protein [Brevibacillus sp. HD1.4A]